NYAGVAIEHLPGRIIAPGFIDLHIHFPQTDMIGSPAPGLLPWLQTYTFLDELLRHGVTSALAFATSHPASVNALMAEAQRRHLRLIAGKVLQDRHSP